MLVVLATHQLYHLLRYYGEKINDIIIVKYTLDKYLITYRFCIIFIQEYASKSIKSGKILY